MSEAAFPLLGAAFVVLVVLPAFALLAKIGLLLIERGGVRGPLHGLNLRYLLLTASSAVPLAWFFSAGLHQAESGKSALTCLVAHDQPGFCVEPGFFALALAVVVTVAWLRSSHRLSFSPASSSLAAEQLRARIVALIEAHPRLANLRDRIVANDDVSFALGTRGLFQRRVVVGTKFAAALTDSMLVSALGHENEHVRSFDPLRYLLLELALGVNPFGRFLLAPHAARWKAAREAHCDREAVLHGAAPIPLAEALVRAARPKALPAVPLGTGDAGVLKLRIRMLLAFAEHAPHRCCSQGTETIPLAFGLLFVALLLPHQTGTQALDALHAGAEYALAYLSR